MQYHKIGSSFISAMAQPFSIQSSALKNLSSPQVHAEHFPFWDVRSVQKVEGKKWWAQEGRRYEMLDIFFIRKMFLRNMMQGIGKNLETFIKHTQAVFETIAWKNSS